MSIPKINSLQKLSHIFPQVVTELIRINIICFKVRVRTVLYVHGRGKKRGGDSLFTSCVSSALITSVRETII